ncbi:PocR ligand-binding domain-containing protein [bacterium]|nr:PocR ligand-binding domain-containing protein [bacterium]
MHLSICLSEDVRPAVSIPHSSSKHSFCALIQQTYKGLNRCLMNDKQGLQIACSNKTPYIYRCHAGLVDGVIPVIFMDRCIAFVMLGQFLTEEPTKERFEEIWQKVNDLPIDKEELEEAYWELPVFSPQLVHKFSWTIFELVNHIKGAITYTLRHSKRSHKRLKELLQRKAEADLEKDLINLQLWLSLSQPRYPYEEERELLTRLRYGTKNSVLFSLSRLLNPILENWENDPLTVRSQVWGIVLSILGVIRMFTHHQIDLLKLTTQYASLLERCKTRDDVVETMSWIMNDLTTLWEEPRLSQSVVERAKRFIMEHYQDELRLETVAKAVHLSPSYFSAIFKQTTGCSFAKYLTKIRIAKAKELLENSDKSITDIALEVGFNDPAYFAAVFRRDVGVSPLVYRKTARKQASRPQP